MRCGSHTELDWVHLGKRLKDEDFPGWTIQSHEKNESLEINGQIGSFKWKAWEYQITMWRELLMRNFQWGKVIAKGPQEKRADNFVITASGIPTVN